MSGKVPFFLTGANAKIKVDGVTLAMCTDVAYSVRVKHANPHVLGVYESFSNDPLSYEVTGSFTVVRYCSGLKDFLHGGATEDPVVKAANDALFSSTHLGRDRPSPRGKQYGTPNDVSPKGNGIGAWGQTSVVKESLDPGQLYRAAGFDIEIIQKAGTATGIIARLRNCRVVGSDFRLTRRGVAVQTFTFQANYADEDSFSATISGVGQTIL